MIVWAPLSELKITPKMENWEILVYVGQDKMCRRHFPKVVTADVVDGKLLVMHEADQVFVQTDGSLTDTEGKRVFPLSTASHYAYFNSPHEKFGDDPGDF